MESQNPASQSKDYGPPPPPPMYSGGHNPPPNAPDQAFAPVVQQPGAMHTNTTVVINQQAPTSDNVPFPRGWSSGMCGCFSDIGICLAVMCCGECYSCCCFMDDVNESCCLPCCFPAAWMGVVRTKIRMKYNIQGSIMDDMCLTSGCCACFTRPCILCQMAREVKTMSQQGKPM